VLDEESEGVLEVECAGEQERRHQGGDLDRGRVVRGREDRRGKGCLQVGLCDTSAKVQLATAKAIVQIEQ
jgi:hypothetical protein